MIVMSEKPAATIVSALPGWSVLQPKANGSELTGFTRTAVIAWYIELVGYEQCDPNLVAHPVTVAGVRRGYAVEEPSGLISDGCDHWPNVHAWLLTRQHQYASAS